MLAIVRRPTMEHLSSQSSTNEERKGENNHQRVSTESWSLNARQQPERLVKQPVPVQASQIYNFEVAPIDLKNKLTKLGVEYQVKEQRSANSTYALRLKDNRRVEALLKCLKELDYRLVEDGDFYRKYFGPELPAKPLPTLQQP